MKKLYVFVISLLGFSILAVTLVTPIRAHAVSPTEWQAGRIIDESVFTNSDAMSAIDVQNFLNAKVGSGVYGIGAGQCDTTGSKTSELGGGSRADYGAAHGNPKPFTCLKDYYEVPKIDPGPGIPASNYGGAAIPAGSRSAAQIIYDASQRYGISPKVILVIIQKESAGPLIIDDWPFRTQFTYTMGAHCPDGPGGAQCDSNYAGFSIQINESARLLRYYLDNMQQPWWTYTKPFQVKQVRWNTQYATYVDANGNSVQCGSEPVYIQNRPTAALYTYTPYQPNQAALNNLYGSVPGSSGFDSRCAAYGNRNFWRIFNDWFGTTRGDAYSAAYAGQSDYPSLNPTAQSTSYVMYRNNGNSTWYDDTSIGGAPAGSYTVHLGTSRQINRISNFAATWPGAARPALTFAAVYEADGTTLAANQHVAQSGQIVKFSFMVTAPSGMAAGTYREYLNPIAEGSPTGLFGDTGTFLDVTVNAVAMLSYVGQSNYLSLAPTIQAPVWATFRNSGSIALYDDTSIGSAPADTHPVHLATTQPLNNLSDFAATWPGAARPALTFAAVYEADGTTLAANQHVAQSGQIVKFSFMVTAPPRYPAGSYNLHIQPILEGTGDGYFPDFGMFWTLTVRSTPVISITNSSGQLAMSANQPGQLNLTLGNVGNLASDSGTQVEATNGSAFKSPAWLSNTKIVTIGSSIAPGSSVPISLSILAPSSASSSVQTLLCKLTSGGQDAPISNDCRASVTVNPASYTAAYMGQSDWPNLAPNQQATVYFKYKNTGNQAWYDDASIGSATWRATMPVHLATAGPINRISQFQSNWPSSTRPAASFAAVYEADGTTLAANQHVAQSGQIVKFSFMVTAPSGMAAGTYREYFQPIVEGSGDGLISYIGTFQDIKLSPETYTTDYAGQSDYPQLRAGQQASVYFKYKNTGNQAWYDDASLSNAPAGAYPVHLATNNPINRISNFAATWPGAARPALTFAAVYEADGTTLAANQHVAQSGQIVKFSFMVTAPSGMAAGTYREYFKPILEGTSTGVLNEPFTFSQISILP